LLVVGLLGFAGTDDHEITFLGLRVDLVFFDLQKLRAERLEEAVFEVLFGLVTSWADFTLSLKLSEMLEVSRGDDAENLLFLLFKVLSAHSLDDRRPFGLSGTSREHADGKLVSRNLKDLNFVNWKGDWMGI